MLREDRQSGGESQVIPIGEQETILLIDSDQHSSDQIRTALLESSIGSFPMEWATQLSEGLIRLGKRGIAAVLFDLSLCGGSGIKTFDKLFSIAPEIPIVVLGKAADEALAIEAVKHGAQDYLLSSHHDIYSLARTLRKAIDRAAFAVAQHMEREMAVVTLNSIGDAVLCTDVAGRVTYQNPSAETMTGWTREEATSRPLTEVLRIADGSTRRTAPNPLERAIQENRTVGLTPNCILIRRDGTEFAIEDSAAPIHDRAGCVIGAVIVFHDVSVARAMSIQMTYSAHYDLVTELPNRLLLRDRTSQSIAAASRHNRPIAILFLDLDHFKHINDSLGHAIGDRLLRSVSKRLVALLRASDTVSREGGDEFVILLSDISDRADAATSAQRILIALNEPHHIEGLTLYINGTLGISIYPEDGKDAETLIQCADMAMYQAKEDGRNRFQFFKQELNLKAAERQSIESGLHLALERDEFLLNYQPKVNLNTNRITGIEALIRWQHPVFGVVYPERFISVAEECGLIVRIGHWVMREACRQARAWQNAGLLAIPIAVNVSAVEFKEKAFVKCVQSILSDTDLEPRFLELELTEGVLMKDVESAASKLRELKEMGIRIAVDDFGMGYSSLSYLRKFPIDVLKIDRSFVNQITTLQDDAILASAIIAMGRSLKHCVVAEGVETQQQKIFLQAHHCLEGQGYLFSKPLGATEFAHLLQNGL